MPPAVPPPLRAPARRTARVRAGLLGFALLGWVSLAAAADEPSRQFDLRRDTAERSLKEFSEQSGRGVIFVASAVQGVRTNPVRGRFTPGEALGRLLEGTGLVSSHDAATGAFAVRRDPGDKPKNGWRAARFPN